MSYMYEWVRLPSTMCERKEYKSLDDALKEASEHIINKDGHPIKILKDGEKILNSYELRDEDKRKFGV